MTSATGGSTGRSTGSSRGGSTGDGERSGCPMWCVTSAAEHAEDDPGTWLHEGPAFGLLRTWLLDGPEPVFTATLAETVTGELTPDDLRQLATDALDAAMWMDRQAGAPHALRGESVVELVRRAHERATRSA